MIEWNEWEKRLDVNITSDPIFQLGQEKFIQQKRGESEMTEEKQTTMIQNMDDVWALIELMGHGKTAGRMHRQNKWGGLLCVDVPDDDGYRTECYGQSSIYSIKFVSEEIARAYAEQSHVDYAYNAPIVTREIYESALMEARKRQDELEEVIRELKHRLTAIEQTQDHKILPALPENIYECMSCHHQISDITIPDYACNECGENKWYLIG